MIELLNRKDFINKLPQIVPSTRYQGSKRRILPWIYKKIKKLRFTTVLDGFGGTGSVSYLFKIMGKKVTYNDFLKANYETGIAFIENNSEILNCIDIEFLLQRNGLKYPRFIEKNFKGIYYFEHENRWLDMIVFNIKNMNVHYKGNTLKIKRALAYHALFQACLSKRPFNLFHRKNLNLRKSNSERKFGNKTTWDTNFELLFRKFAQEASLKVFNNQQKNKAYCKDIMKFSQNDFDLVYLDPPYARSNEKKTKDYPSLYHFLEGLTDYDNWESRIDMSQKHKPIIKKNASWKSDEILENFEKIFEKFQRSIIVVSYGSPGNPSIFKIRKTLQRFKSNISIYKKEYSYKLNKKNNKNMQELLIVGK